MAGMRLSPVAVIAALAACALPAEKPPTAVEVPAPMGDAVPAAGGSRAAAGAPPPSSGTPPRVAALAVSISEGADEPLSDLVRTVTLEFARSCTHDASAPPPWSLVLDVTIERRPVDVPIVGVVPREVHGAPGACVDALTRVYLSGTWPNGAGTERYRVRVAYE